MKRIVLFVLVALALVSCSGGDEPLRAIYHWKTIFNPTQYELQWLRDHRVQRLYLRLFDVDVYDNDDYGNAAPIATTRFLQPLPDDMEVIPVVYITNEAMGRMWGYRVAELIAERVEKMADCNGFELKELQVDCDWTERTRSDYYYFCRSLRECLHEKGVRLSSTVRLHQVDTTLADLPVDGKVLMLYNTGDLRSPRTANSILDYSDVKPYLRRIDASMLDSMDFAWPVFGWGVAFDANGRFQRLVPSSALASDTSSASLREEWGRVDDIQRVQRRLPARGRHTTILYHLDSLNLSKYTYDEIETIYSR